MPYFYDRNDPVLFVRVQCHEHGWLRDCNHWSILFVTGPNKAVRLDMESRPGPDTLSTNGSHTLEDVNYVVGPRCIRYWDFRTNRSVGPRLKDFNRTFFANKRHFFKMPARGAEIRFWV